MFLITSMLTPFQSTLPVRGATAKTHKIRRAFLQGFPNFQNLHGTFRPRAGCDSAICRIVPDLSRCEPGGKSVGTWGSHLEDGGDVAAEGIEDAHLAVRRQRCGRSDQQHKYQQRGKELFHFDARLSCHLMEWR